jgi:hypothetical protein
MLPDRLYRFSNSCSFLTATTRQQAQWHWIRHAREASPERLNSRDAAKRGIGLMRWILYCQCASVEAPQALEIPHACSGLDTGMRKCSTVFQTDRTLHIQDLVTIRLGYNLDNGLMSCAPAQVRMSKRPIYAIAALGMRNNRNAISDYALTTCSNYASYVSVV